MDLLAVGFGGGLSLTPMTATVAAVRSERAGMASAVHNSMRQVGQAPTALLASALIPSGVLGRA